MMTLNINSEDLARLVRKLDKKERDVAIKRGMNRAGLNLVHWIMRERLSAPPGPNRVMLHKRSGRLISSIGSKTKADGIWDYNNETYTLKLGTNVEYAKIHEEGYGVKQQGTLVRGFIRRDKSKDEYIKTYVGGKLKRKRVITGAQGVGSHLRFDWMPARPFMSASIEDRQNQDDTLTIITQALQEALDKE
jgi:phage gpG-like protein